MPELLFVTCIIAVILYAVCQILRAIYSAISATTKSLFEGFDISGIFVISGYKKFLRNQKLPLRVWRMYHKRYMKTEHWQTTSYDFRVRKFRCEVASCSVSGWKNINAHHLHYNSLMREKDSDLLALCKTHHYSTHNGKTLILKNGKVLKPFGR